MLSALVCAAALSLVDTDDPNSPLRTRRPGAPLVDERPPDPAGWRLAPTISSPYALGVGLGYWAPLKYFTLKGGLDLGVASETGITLLKFQDLRAYGGVMYYFLPNANDGPYVETGLDYVRSHGGTLTLVNWPVVPHLGFGTVFRFGAQTVVDLNFAATANGLLTLSGGILFGPGNEDNGLTKPWEPYPQP